MRGGFCLLVFLSVFGCHSRGKRSGSWITPNDLTNPCYHISQQECEIREQRTLYIPAYHKLTRGEDNITWSLDRESVRPITLEAGKVSTLQYRVVSYVHWGDSTIWIGFVERGGDTLFYSGDSLHPTLWGIPREGQKYVLDTRIYIVEAGCATVLGRSTRDSILWSDAIVSDSI